MADVSQIAANGITYNIKDAVARSELENKILTLTVGSFSSFPKVVSNADITSDMVVLDCTFGTPSSILSDVTWTTANGSITLTGTISGSTTAVIILGKTDY